MPLEEATKKLKEITLEKFIFKPLKTMEDFNEIQDKMKLCLIRNEYYNKVKKGEIFMYIVYKKNTNKLKGEVVEFRIKKETLETGQISGYDNHSTENYEKIKELAKKIQYNDIVEKQK